ncbi:hypothetical protein J1614_005501 [Plenodomus biglobosus]|nr:hypothetical protein J1614_005501 [Plenodomus biglobosus]
MSYCDSNRWRGNDDELGEAPGRFRRWIGRRDCPSRTAGDISTTLIAEKTAYYGADRNSNSPNRQGLWRTDAVREPASYQCQ